MSSVDLPPIRVTNLMADPPKPPTKRGTSNGNERGSSTARRSRRAWMMLTYASNVPGFVRCYRCGCLLFNPDDYAHRPHPEAPLPLDTAFVRQYGTRAWTAAALTVDRIIPGCRGGTYRRNNIRPACGACNSETGGALARTGKRTP